MGPGSIVQTSTNGLIEIASERSNNYIVGIASSANIHIYDDSYFDDPYFEINFNNIDLPFYEQITIFPDIDFFSCLKHIFPHLFQTKIQLENQQEMIL